MRTVASSTPPQRNMIALAASAFPWPGNYGPRWGDPGAVMLACRKLGDLQQTKHYYPSIPCRSCYCAPMIAFWCHKEEQRAGLGSHETISAVATMSATIPMKASASKSVLSHMVGLSASRPPVQLKLARRRASIAARSPPASGPARPAANPRCRAATGALAAPARWSDRAVAGKCSRRTWAQTTHFHHRGA
jgi:hypothetical protein